MRTLHQIANKHFQPNWIVLFFRRRQINEWPHIIVPCINECDDRQTGNRRFVRGKMILR